MPGNIKEKINGYGSAFRFVTPILVTISIMFLSWIRGDLEKIEKHFTNHLAHHQDLEIGYERRISILEGRQNNISLDITACETRLEKINDLLRGKL